MKTIVLALTDLGHQLDLVVYDADRSGVPKNVRVFWRSPLGLGRTINNVIWRSFLGPLSLNESAYFNPSECSYLRDLARINHYDLVIADMVRTAPLAEATGRPLLIDMDDLLSERYAGYLRGDGGIDKLLGYYGERLPSWFSKVLLMIAKPALAWEVKRLKNRELYWVGRAKAASLVSDLEAKKALTEGGEANPFLADGRRYPGKSMVSGREFCTRRRIRRWHGLPAQCRGGRMVPKGS